MKEYHMHRKFHRLTGLARRYAGLLGLGLAAAVLLGAATVVPATAAGTVTSGDIRNQTIRSWDISRGGVASSEIRQQSIKSWDISRGGVGTSEIRNGSVREDDLNEEVSSQLGQGPKGDKGDPGQDGQDGADGVSGYEVDGFYTRVGDSDRDAGRGGDVSLGPAIPAGEVVQLTSFCAEGKQAIGGGFSNGNTQPGSDLTVRESHPSEFQPIAGDPEGSVRAAAWSVTLENETDTAQHAQVFVVCAAVN